MNAELNGFSSERGPTMSTLPNANSRVLIIALDGATWRVLKPLMARGRMPNFSRLVEHGFRATLLSTVPWVSPTAWASLMTGKNPGKHGIYGFLELDPAQYSTASYDMSVGYPVNGSYIHHKTLWELISEHGKRVGVINVPMTYPPRAVNGFLIASFLTPPGSKEFTYPADLAGQLDEYRIDLDYGAGYGYLKPQSFDDYERFLEDLSDVLQRRIRTMLKLMQNHPWDFFMACFTETDRLQHSFWPCLEPEYGVWPEDEIFRFRPKVLAQYEQLDQAIGTLVSLAGDGTTVFILSDHGFRGRARRIVHVNRWLAEGGWLALERSSPITASVRLGLRIARHVFQQFGLKETMKTQLPDSIVARASSLASTPPSVDWENTKAWSVGLLAGTCGIWLNVQGKMPHGTVEQGAQYENLRNELVEYLKGLRDPETGEGVIKHVYTKEELYHGRWADKAPDLVCVFNPQYNAPCSLAFNSYDLFWDNANPFNDTGDHEQEGIFVAAGANIRAGLASTPLRIEDIAPTILYLLDLPIPEDMDGQIVEQALSFDMEVRCPHYEGSSATEEGDSGRYSEDDAAKVLERLRGLGYVE